MPTTSKDLFASAGTFWQRWFPGSDELGCFFNGFAASMQRAFDNVNDLSALANPVGRDYTSSQRYLLIPFTPEEVDPIYGSGITYGDFIFGYGTGLYEVAYPDDVDSFSAIISDPSDPATLMLPGQDYMVDTVRKRIIVSDTASYADSVFLLGARSLDDRLSAIRGLPLGLVASPSSLYARTLEAAFLLLTRGPTTAAISALLSSACGFEYAERAETVKLYDQAAGIVVTDRNAYESAEEYAVGYKFKAGQSMSAACSVTTFRSWPTQSRLPAISVRTKFGTVTASNELVVVGSDGIIPVTGAGASSWQTANQAVPGDEVVPAAALLGDGRWNSFVIATPDTIPDEAILSYALKFIYACRPQHTIPYILVDGVAISLYTYLFD